MKTTPLLIMSLLFATACQPDHGVVTKLQYVPDMADAPTQKTQRNYIDPPEGSVAMNSFPYPKTPEESEQALAMPQQISADPAQEAEGKVHYETYCLVCHGADAKGYGPVVGKEGEVGLMPTPPDLTNAIYLTRGDGFFFHRITFGANIMPAYGHATTPTERWQIVRYLRTLQKAGGTR